VEASAPTPRRAFLTTLLAAISAVLAALMAIPLVRFSAYPVFHAGGNADWFSLGNVDGFAAGAPTRAEVTVRKQDGWRVTQAKQTVWVTHDAKGALRVLSAVCPHLGCIVPWNDAKQSFTCPCHKGFFAKDGERVSGPPPRGLDALDTKIENGVLFVRYQYFRQLTPNREAIG
jgi:menaquinol-cytochrome c reductase iron-sulfur subunit